MGNVTFLNNTSPTKGGATYLLNAVMTAKVTFINNTAVYGGALQLFNSSINIINSNMFFVGNKASVWDGGAIHLMNSKINISKYANVSFIRNTAAVREGAMMQTSGTFNVERNSNLSFIGNTAGQGGALYLFSTVLQYSYNASIYFTNNSATDVGGAIYALVQPNFPCFYLPLFNREASVFEFENNSAGNKIGEHIYGGSIFSDVCTYAAFELLPPAETLGTRL